uniref:uncharacterized protein LOC120337846 isoform X2 n=1 Tax=Styela clava TaxID=7725 RepID=UPI00193A8DC2|nr:uncharacterized protein LOC120337846 isoform X2 [Styela clava]
MTMMESNEANTRKSKWKWSIKGYFEHGGRRRKNIAAPPSFGRRKRPLSQVPENEEKHSVSKSADDRYPKDGFMSDGNFDDTRSDITQFSSYSASSEPNNPAKYSTLPSRFRSDGFVSMDEWNSAWKSNKPENQPIDSGSDTFYSALKTKESSRRGRRRERRHTIGGPQSNFKDDPNVITQEPSSPRASSDNFSAEFNVISRKDAANKREAFLNYLQRAFPQHADAISGKEKPAFPPPYHVRSRASYSPQSEASSSLGYLVPSVESSYPGFCRGSRLRASLPIVRTDSGSKNRPRVVYLQYEGETRVAELPSELTSLDTIRALFVQSYPGLLTMPVLDKQRHGLMIKNTKTGKFDEIDNVKKIKDRSFIRARPRDGVSGIPMPGAKKASALKPSPVNSTNKFNNRTGLPQNTNQNNNTVVENSKINKKATSNGIKAKIPTLSPVHSPERLTTNSKPKNSNVNSRGFGYVPKLKMPSPKPQSPTNEKENNRKDSNNNSNVSATDDLHSPGQVQGSNNATPSPTGNGIGGGSLSKTGFSYHHGTGVPAYRRPENGSAENTIRVVQSPNSGKSKLQPLGEPLSREPSRNAKRSIQPPKTKLYGSLIPASKLRSTPSNSPAPISGNLISGTETPREEEDEGSLQGNKGSIKQNKGPPPPLPIRPKTPTRGRAAPSGAPPPIAPKPTVSKLGSAHSSFSSVPPSQKANIVSKDTAASKIPLDPIIDGGLSSDLAVFSNIKRPESPERKASIYARGSTRSLRPRQLPKPVSIPQVPPMNLIHRQVSDEVSKSEINIRDINNENAGNGYSDQNLTKKSSVSAPNLTPLQDDAPAFFSDTFEQSPSLIVSQDIGEEDCIHKDDYAILTSEKVENIPENNLKPETTEHTSSLKRGLSSLKRFIPGRSSGKQSKSSSENLIKPTLEIEHEIPILEDENITKSEDNNSTDLSVSNVAQPESADPAHHVNVHSIASMFENDSKLHNEANPSHRNHNSTLKHPAIPTTNLVSTLVKSGNNGVQRKESLGGNSSDTSQSGIVKKSNLVKTGSYNSVNSSDSSTSNATNNSSTVHRQPSVHKKVSFQDNVMVSDGHGSNTYVQRLKSKGDESGYPEVQSDAKSRASAAEQLKIQATESDFKEYLNNRALTSPVSPRSPGRVTSPTLDRKSAVEAAIETITGKPSARKININDSYRAATQGTLTQLLSPSQIPVTIGESTDDGFAYNVTTSYQPQSSYKEMWYPRHSQMSSAPAYTNPIRSMTPNPTPAYNHYSAAIMPPGQMSNVAYSTAPSSVNIHAENLVAMKNEPQAYSAKDEPYFQTQSGFPYDDNEMTESDPTPYYERCGSWKRGAPTSNVQHIGTPVSLGAVDSISKINTIGEQTQKGVTDGLEDDKEIELRKLGWGEFEKTAPTDEATNERVKAMEQKIATLTGMVETMITHTDADVNIGDSANATKSQQMTYDSGVTSSDSDSTSLKDVRKQMLQLRATASELKKQLDDIKRQQRTNFERMNDMIVTRSRELTSLIATTAGSEHAPVRARRLALDRERSTYGDNASLTERQLTEVEGAVEELRNEVVERRCRVNMREVEALALQLSQAGRTIANLKSSFPSICDEMRTVGTAETEVIIQEEKFMDTEPARLDEQLKRCKQLTQTLFTLKKLATVQEARSKTPVNILSGQGGMMGPRPETPSHYLASLMSYGSPNGRPGERVNADDLKKVKNVVLGDVRSQKVDSTRRMQSIQALELAEKALRRTDNFRVIEERQEIHLKEIYFNGNKRRDEKITTSLSESSSVDSLPSPPPPMSNMTSSQQNNLHSVEVPTYASSTCSMSTASSAAAPHRPVENLISPDGGYISSEILSPQHQQPSSLPTRPLPTNRYPQQNQTKGPVSALQKQNYRSNSLQRTRSQRMQQMQQYEEYQRQRSRTPNPFPTPMQFDKPGYVQPQAEYVNQQYDAYGAQYNYQQAYQDPYGNKNPQTYAPAPLQPYQTQQFAEAPYQSQMQYQQYGPTPDQMLYQVQQQQQPQQKQQQSTKNPTRQLRRPTTFSHKQNHPSSPPYQDPSQGMSTSYSPSPLGNPTNDDVMRRRQSGKQQQQPQQQSNDKSQRLKDQYSKLQQMQRKNKINQVKRPPSSRSQIASPSLVNNPAKSSDV